MALEQMRNAVEPVIKHIPGSAQHARTRRIESEGNGNGNSQRLAKALGWFSVGLGAAEIVAPGRVSGLIGSKKNDKLVRSMGARELANGVAILKSPNTSAFLWTRVGGDVVHLALLGYALRTRRANRKRLIAAAAAVGGVAALDVLCGKRLGRPAGPIHLVRSITIGKLASELYDRWQELFPQVVAHFAEVHLANGDRAHWRINLPAGRKIEWESQIVDRLPGEFLAWKSVAGLNRGSEGSVHFSPAPADLGTEVTLHLLLHPPGVALGESLLKMFNVVPRTVAERALRRFKSLVETGEIPTLERNPSARDSQKSLMGRLTQ